MLSDWDPAATHSCCKVFLLLQNTVADGLLATEQGRNTQWTRGHKHQGLPVSRGDRGLFPVLAQLAHIDANCSCQVSFTISPPSLG